MPAEQPPARPPKVYFFATCLVDLFCPEAGIDAISLLEREGIEVYFPAGQTCCGQPALNSGYPDEARQVARAQLDLFPEDWPVIVPSGSCAGTFRHHYAALFADDAALATKAARLAGRVFELTEFLVEVLGVRWQSNGAPQQIALHTSCAARREMGTHLVARQLLGQLGSVSLVDHADEAECCGFGGTFVLRQPEISATMARDKAAALKASGAAAFVSADCGCLLNIDRTLAREGAALRGQHLASFLLRHSTPAADASQAEPPRSADGARR